MPVVLGRAATVLMALPLLSAAAQASSGEVGQAETDTTLFFHPYVHVMEFPVTTQQPLSDPWEATSFSGASTLTCVGRQGEMLGQGNLLGTGTPFHRYLGYSSPGPVTRDEGQWRVHPERGLGANVTISSTHGVRLHWFLRLSSGPASEADPYAAFPAPRVRLAAEVRAPDPVSIDDKAYGTGHVLLDGSTEPVTLVAGRALLDDGRPSTQVHGELTSRGEVYEFVVDLQVQDAVIPRLTGFVAAVHVYAELPGCDDPATTGTIAPATLEAHWDDDRKPRLEMRHSPALVVERAATVTEVPQPEFRLLFLEWSVGSAWGNYDVDVANATVHVEGPGELPFVPAYIIQRTVEYHHHNDPYEGGWVVTLGEGEPDGRYTATLSVPNLQGTAMATSAVTFHLQDGRLLAGPPEAMPLPTVALLAAGLLGLAGWLRRDP